MTKEDWGRLKHFNIGEKWGDPLKMDIALLLLLDKLREEIGKPFVIHCGYDIEGHAPHSQHYKGGAADLHVEGMSLTEAFQRIDKLWWVGGLGIYAQWNQPGFHLDIGRRRRWSKVQNRYFNILQQT